MSIGLSPAIVGAQNDGDDIRILLEFIPEPSHAQMLYNETYIFGVVISNLGMDIVENASVPGQPGFKYSGSLILQTSIRVRREGVYGRGSDSIPYTLTLQSWENTYDLPVPALGSNSSKWFSYTAEIGYGGKSANLEDWVTFDFDAQVYVEWYLDGSAGRKYYLGDSLGEVGGKWYVISLTKEIYVKSVHLSMGRDLNQARLEVVSMELELGEELEIDITAYQNAYDAMESFIEEGDYVSAMSVYTGYEPTWREEVITKLKERVGELKPLAGLLEEYSSSFEDLTVEYEELQTEFENFTAAQLLRVDELSTQLSAARSNSRMYLFGMVALAAVLVAALVRTFKPKLPGSSGEPSET
ncbi:MAG: hypothetical protein JSV18_04475 [Candidatus Bathyarchaeota archaeon]|nr:MAG: hypothetical protein JSV18_04475 [Candidatus Bathyarchaeota archaeon]